MQVTFCNSLHSCYGRLESAVYAGRSQQSVNNVVEHMAIWSTTLFNVAKAKGFCLSNIKVRPESSLMLFIEMVWAVFECSMFGINLVSVLSACLRVYILQVVCWN